MSQPDSLSARYGALIVELANAVEANDQAAFRGAFERVRDGLNIELLPELRRVTANAQHALERFREEARLDKLAGTEVPDARKRLAHVVQLTDEAAHRTLDLVERCGPLVEQNAKDAAQLLEQWSSYGQRALAVESLWPERTLGFLENALADADRVRGCLTEMLMAQGYQDITGQIIRGVISLVGELENVLAELVRIANGDGDTRRMPALRLPEKEIDWRAGVGPQVPGVAAADGMSAQDDIDALLSNFSGGG